MTGTLNRLSRLVWLMVLGSLLFGGCAASARPDGRRLIYGLTLDPSGFDPHIHRSAEIGIVLRQVYDTLVYRDPSSMAFVPGLAEQWNLSDDGLVYTFTLREGVMFHDGTPLNAEAVAANLDRITTPSTGSQKARFMLGPYAGREVVDSRTIRIQLSEPYAPLLDALSQVYLGIASPQALNAYSLQRYQFHQVGTGPYIFEELLPGSRVVLRRNPDYTWGPSFVVPEAGTPTFDTIEFRFYTDAATRAPAVERDEVHVVGEVPPLDARRAAGNTGLRVLQTPIPGQPLQFLINTALAPTDSLAVRQALLLATNREAIRDTVFQGLSPVAWGPLSASTLYANRALRGSYAFNVEQALGLLATDGWVDDDGDGVLERNGAPLVIRVIVPPWGQTPQVAQLLQAQWRTVGVDATLVSVPTYPALLAQVDEGGYHLAAFNDFGLDPSVLAPFYTSSGALNWSNHADPALDALFAEAQATLDDGTRAALFYEIQRVIMKEALVLPIRDVVNINASRANIQGLAFDAYGWFPLLSRVTVGL